MSLSLVDVFTYAKCDVSSRSAIEGKQILMDCQIIVCGKIEMKNTIQIKALILQTSHLNDLPHEVNGELVNHSLSIIPFTCSCKAGASECCKHVVAVLPVLNRNKIADLESFSSTDIKCQWSKLRQPTLTKYKPLPVDTFDCCYKKSKY
ncbi:PREDICTED: uncharacterized protein LOC107173427 [Diuraphis noxia]|uniref:uncharacterized protein LOC107173427 n=1 Tax=Diuraphis noxia TaxID=143948 RepID=UPI0007635C3A|nr:PREDICTED: uncharacterized protein LOC107173427 [Diuraphis noxia]